MTGNTAAAAAAAAAAQPSMTSFPPEHDPRLMNMALSHSPSLADSRSPESSIAADWNVFAESVDLYDCATHSC